MGNKPMTSNGKHEESSPAPPPFADDLIDGWREALAEVLAEQQHQWARERALLEAQAAAIISDLRRHVTELEAKVTAMVADRLALVRDGQDGVPGPVGERGEKGEQGAPGENGATGAQGNQGERGEKGDAGECGERGDVGPQGDHGQNGERGPQGDRGERGEPGERGERGAPGMLPAVKVYWPGAVHYEGAIVAYDGGTFQACCDTAKAPDDPGEWVCLAVAGKDGRTPTVRGTFAADEKYRALDIVALNGGSFIARRNDPGDCPGAGWQSLTMPGKRGERGIRGEKGDRGEPGKPGSAGPAIVGWQIDRKAYAAVPILDDGSQGAALELRSLFEQFQIETH